MKRMTLTLVLISVVAIALLNSGCGEKNMSDSQRVIKLLKNDKLALNNEIKDFTKQVDHQKSLVKDCEKEKAAAQGVNDESLQALLLMFSEAESKAQVLQIENEALKKQLKEASK